MVSEVLERGYSFSAVEISESEISHVQKRERRVIMKKCFALQTNSLYQKPCLL